MSKYWETETPATVTTNKNVLLYYSGAEKLSVSRPPWTDDDGNERQGKTVTYDVGAVLESGAEAMAAARGVFTAIVQRIDERLNLLGGAI